MLGGSIRLTASCALAKTTKPRTRRYTGKHSAHKAKTDTGGESGGCGERLTDLSATQEQLRFGLTAAKKARLDALG